MVKITENVISEIVKKITESVRPDKIIIFGSYAKGKASADSDLDLIIIEKEPFTRERTRRQETSRIRSALSSIHHPKDILVFSTNEVEKWKKSINHIIYTGLHEGRVIYER